MKRRVLLYESVFFIFLYGLLRKVAPMQNVSSNRLFCFNRLVAVVVSFALFYADCVNVKSWILGALSGSSTLRNRSPCGVFSYIFRCISFVIYLSFLLVLCSCLKKCDNFNFATFSIIIIILAKSSNTVAAASCVHAVCSLLNHKFSSLILTSECVSKSF